MGLRSLKDELLVGTFMGFTSTGGRLTVSDYSGRLDIDQVVSNLQLGLTLQNRFNVDGLLSPYIQFYASSDFTKFHLTEQLQIGSSKNKDAKLQIGGGNAFNDFSGFRAGISLTITAGS